MEIAKLLKVSHAKIYYWFKKYGIARRSRSESSYVKQNVNGNPFNIKSRLTLGERNLLLAGLMLYWAEGSRRNKHVIQIANLDYRMLTLFIKLLRNICGVSEHKVCLTVQLYKRFNETKTRSYWSRTLGIPPRFIAVNVHSDTRSKPNNQWSQYGLCPDRSTQYEIKKLD